MVTNWYLFAKSLLNLIDKNVSIEHVLTPGNQTMREKRETLPGTMTHLAGGIVKGVRSWRVFQTPCHALAARGKNMLVSDGGTIISIF